VTLVAAAALRQVLAVEADTREEVVVDTKAVEDAGVTKAVEAVVVTKVVEAEVGTKAAEVTRVEVVAVVAVRPNKGTLVGNHRMVVVVAAAAEEEEVATGTGVCVLSH
jgi:hypothetical protein